MGDFRLAALPWNEQVDAKIPRFVWFRHVLPTSTQRIEMRFYRIAYRLFALSIVGTPADVHANVFHVHGR